jgi:uncharacterized membrane protein
MDLTTELLVGRGWIGHAIFWPVVLLAMRRARWSIWRDGGAVQVWIAASVVVLAIWHISFEVTDGLSGHLLGATALTLMFRWRFAILGMMMALFLHTLSGQGDWVTMGWNGVFMVLIPVAVSAAVYRVTVTFLPANFYIYIFVAAFFGAASAMSAVGVVSSEAFITGGALSIFVVFRPSWVATFDDRRYLGSR